MKRSSHLLYKVLKNLSISAVLLYYFTICELYSQHSLMKLPYPVNTDYFNEICPVFSRDEQTMFFTRSGSPEFNKTLFINGTNIYESHAEDEYHSKLAEVYGQIAGRKILDPVSSNFNQDIYIVAFEGEVVKTVFHPNYPLNNALPNSICSPYGSGSEYIVINEFEEVGGMKEGISLISLNDKFESSFPRPIKILDFNRSAEEVNFSMSEDRNHIILSMAATDGHYKKDLFVSVRFDDTTYLKPIPIFSLNTPYNETTPFISHDKKKLFFASDRPGGKGGLDIYYAERLDYSYEKWSEPIPLSQPLNTKFDESHPYVFRNGNKVFFTSNRDGNSDIFSVKLNRSSKSKKVKVKVKVTDANGKKFPAEINWGYPFEKEGIVWNGYFRSKNGEHVVTLDENRAFVFMAENRGLTTAMHVIDVQELYDQDVSEVTINLTIGDKSVPTVTKVVTATQEESVIPTDLKEGATVVLSNIYFKVATAEVLEASLVNIKKLAKVLVERPNLVINIEGHTDNVGDKKDLKILSEQRAQTIKNILISEGGKAHQINAIGYGDSRPVTDNSTEEKRQQNRRVEIRVVRS